MRWQSSLRDQVPGLWLEANPHPAPDPRLVVYNHELAKALGLDPDLAANAAAWFSGAALPPGTRPLALAYAGHQFGGFNPQLGDGRAHLLGEFRDETGRLWDIQLKGSGRSAFSRGGDGKAALGPMLREYLISEAMAALGVPTTRALAVVTTGEEVWRDKGPLTGAVLARLAASHIRIGSFQFLSARGDWAGLRQLLDHTIARHDPDLAPGDALGLFSRVMQRQSRLIAAWMGLGFVHGVMNTDNMTLSGETIDYGPCAFMEAYAPGTVFSSIDRQGRYAYANQPRILGWNLARLAEAILPLIDADQDRAISLAEEALSGLGARYAADWLAVMRAKLGLAGTSPQDETLANDFLALIEGQDWTRAFAALTRAAAAATPGQAETALGAVCGPGPGLADWMLRWRARLDGGSHARMASANPVVIARNHLVEAALDAAEAGDLAPFTALLAEVRRPFAPAEGREAFALPAPTGFGPYVTFCGT